jgi:rhodanese-related sulfurtransferase
MLPSATKKVTCVACSASDFPKHIDSTQGFANLTHQTMFNFFSRPTYPTISPAALKERLKKEKVVLLDVREPYEHAEKNIPNSILIPLGSLPQQVKKLEPYKGQEIVVYCRSGNRSGQACEFLQKLGYKAINLEGGMLAW